MTDYVGLAIVGAAVSGLVQFLKTQTFVPARVAVIALSLVGAIVYYLFRASPMWSNFLEILVVANTVYALLITYFEA